MDPLIQYIIPCNGHTFQESNNQFKTSAKNHFSPHYCTEIVSEKIWYGGISPVRCEALLRSINISNVVEIRRKHMNRLHTKFPGIMYSEFEIDDEDEDRQIETRMLIINFIVNLVERTNGRIFVYEVVVGENTVIVAEMAYAILNGIFFRKSIVERVLSNMPNKLLQQLREHYRYLVRVGFAGRLVDEIVEMIAEYAIIQAAVKFEEQGLLVAPEDSHLLWGGGILRPCCCI